MIRVFPRRTSYTPADSLAFVGDPPLFRPDESEVHISCAFTWDIPEARRLAEAWAQYYPVVRLGGPAFDTPCESFTPGRYLRRGITFTSRGCNRNCPWCLVPKREGKLMEYPDFAEGHIIQDNNFLQCSCEHRLRVYAMLSQQRHSATFAGGLEADLVDVEIAAELRDLRIEQVFLACDTDAALPQLSQALSRLAFLSRDKLRVYVLCGFAGQTIEQAEARLRKVWDYGGLPFAQLYQPPERWIAYSPEWRSLARRWSRPAATKAIMLARKGGENNERRRTARGDSEGD